MTLKKREKILAGAAGILAALLAGWFLFYGADGRSSSRLRDARKKLADEVAKKEAVLEAAHRTSAQLAKWQRRSLPSNAAIAQSLYQNWLRGLADKAGFRQLTVDSSEGQSRRNLYTLFQFTVRGRCRLGQLIPFLHAFYSADHMQLIRRLDVSPLEDSEDLKVDIRVEALSLPGAESKDQLCAQPGTRLKLAKLSDYSGPIVDRNLFASYEPPREAPRRPEFDPSRYAVVTGIVGVDDVHEVWLEDRTAGKHWKLKEGEKFEVGGVSGSIKSIGLREVVLEFDGRERRLANGQNLHGVALDAVAGAGGSPPSFGRGFGPSFDRGSGPPSSDGRGSSSGYGRRGGRRSGSYFRGRGGG